jgi:hypothetical protein
MMLLKSCSPVPGYNPKLGFDLSVPHNFPSSYIKDPLALLLRIRSFARPQIGTGRVSSLKRMVELKNE